MFSYIQEITKHGTKFLGMLCEDNAYCVCLFLFVL
jgi:hypothetical protein